MKGYHTFIELEQLRAELKRANLRVYALSKQLEKASKELLHKDKLEKELEQARTELEEVLGHKYNDPDFLLATELTDVERKLGDDNTNPLFLQS